MAVDVPLRCDCGVVSGVAKNVSPETGNHIVCYCDDCQAFAHYLEHDDDILDEYGGTDIFQLTPAQVQIHQGKDQLRCIRLTPKGLYRWYTDCCRTPIGNMISAGIPFICIVHNFMDDEGVRDINLGPVLFYAFGKFATETPPDDKNDKGLPFKIMFRAISKMIVAKFRGHNNPNAFFDESGKPISEPIILSEVNK
jgi:uncharacterized protein DUF6151